MFSVAPYAERYLGLLNDKEAQRRYFEADLTTLTKNLNSKYIFLLIYNLEKEIIFIEFSTLVQGSSLDPKLLFADQDPQIENQ